MAVKSIDKPRFVNVVQARASQERPVLVKTLTAFLL